MPHQRAVTIAAAVRPEREADLEALLASMGDGVANGSVVDLGALEGVHFARFLVLPAAVDYSGARLPAYLIYMSDIDVSVGRHLRQLVETAGTGLDRLFGGCVGYPAGQPTPAERLAYLRASVIPTQARYYNTVGRSVQQVQLEAELHDGLEDFLDRDAAARGEDAPGVWRRVRGFVAGERRLKPALSPAAGPGLRFRLGELVHLIAVPLILLLLLPLLLIAAPIFLVVLRLHELRDKVLHDAPDPARVAELSALEDHLVHNPFAAAGMLKPGPFRRWTVVALLAGIDYTTRHIFNRGDLAGVKTIHAARWVFLDDRRRVVFASNYDGSLESYMDDFVDKLAWGLNIVFSNGYGYPKTRFLVLGGAHDELAFKDYLRIHQVPTRVWFSAYGRLTNANIANNAAIRQGLRREPAGAEAQSWVEAL